MNPTFMALWEGKNPEEILRYILTELLRRVPALEGVAVADAQGLTITSGFRGRGPRESTQTAAAAGLLLIESARSVFRNMGLPGEPWWVVIEGGGNTVVGTSIAGRPDTLIALLKPNSPLEQVKPELQRTAILIAEVLDRL